MKTTCTLFLLLIGCARAPDTDRVARLESMLSTPTVEPDVPEVEPEPEPAEVKTGLYVVKWTADWCGPCQTWNKTQRPILDAAGIDVVDVPPEPGMSIPRFAIYDHATETRVYGYLTTGGRNPSYNITAASIIATIDMLQKRQDTTSEAGRQSRYVTYQGRRYDLSTFRGCSSGRCSMCNGPNGLNVQAKRYRTQSAAPDQTATHPDVITRRSRNSSTAN